jgi:2-amino-4-hydroxy-6-hydroxymethyldihydropteridine diphosphokinase
LKRDLRMQSFRMYVVGLGSNLGARFATIASAVARLDRAHGCRVAARGRVYESEPLGPPQPLYLNSAVGLDSALPPEALLDVLLEIEAALGRVRDVRWGPRIIDLDLLWGPRPFSSTRLTVPHAGLAERWFALAPLVDVAQDTPGLAELARSAAEQLSALGGVPYAVRSAPFGEAAARMFDAPPA